MAESNKMIRTFLKKLLNKFLKSQNIQKSKKFKLKEFKGSLISQGNFHSDYTSSLALQVASFFSLEPIKLANFIKKWIETNYKGRTLEKVEVVSPGFLNFSLSEYYLKKSLKKILIDGVNFADLNIGKQKKIQVEFISANPTGPLTVANSRGGPFGDVLANVLRKAGFEVEKAYYINDHGGQILSLGHSVLKDKEAKYQGKYIDELHKLIHGKDPQKVGKEAAKFICQKMIKKTVGNLGIHYDEWFSESRLYKEKRVDKIIGFLRQKNLLYNKNGALWFKSSKYGDNRDRVIVKSDGAKTYLAGDIAYHQYKFRDKGFDKVINIWGADHFGDVPGLQSGVTALGYKGKLQVILLQFVTVYVKGAKVRMSKRQGNYITMDELLKAVGKDVVRFFFLERSAETHLNFDLALARQHSEKNPVYYIQYAFARIESILRKAREANLLPAGGLESQIKRKISKLNLSPLHHPSELNLIKQLLHLPEVVEDTALDYQVQRLPKYALDLARSFHRFYRDCRVLPDSHRTLGSRDKSFDELSEARLALILATRIVLKETLDLLGISAPQRM